MIAPAAPTNFKSETETSLSCISKVDVSFSWGASTTWGGTCHDTREYRIYMNDTLVGTASATAAKFNIDCQDASNTFAVVAYNGAIESSRSDGVVINFCKATYPSVPAGLENPTAVAALVPGNTMFAYFSSLLQIF